MGRAQGVSELRVTRLISPQPGRLGPEGSGGDGLVPTVPLINMYLGLLCSKVMGGRRRRRAAGSQSSSAWTVRPQPPLTRKRYSSYSIIRACDSPDTPHTHPNGYTKTPIECKQNGELGSQTPLFLHPTFTPTPKKKSQHLGPKHLIPYLTAYT